MQPSASPRPSLALLLLAAALALASAARQQVMPCSQPQPRAIQAGELAPGAVGLLDPPYAVLHRCDDRAGLCLGGLACAATATQEVQLVFLLSDPVTGDGQYRLVVASNHTSCGCAPLHD